MLPVPPLGFFDFSVSSSPTSVYRLLSMVVRIRLQRHGRIHRPFYRIAVADSHRHVSKKVIDYIVSSTLCTHYTLHNTTAAPTILANTRHSPPPSSLPLPVSLCSGHVRPAGGQAWCETAATERATRQVLDSGWRTTQRHDATTAGTVQPAAHSTTSVTGAGSCSSTERYGRQRRAGRSEG